MNLPKWHDRVKPLMERFRELDALMTWEGYVSLNTARPRQKDLIGAYLIKRANAPGTPATSSASTPMEAAGMSSGQRRIHP